METLCLKRGFRVRRVIADIIKVFLISLLYYITWDALRGFITENNSAFLLILNGLICSYWIYYLRIRFINSYSSFLFSTKKFMSLYALIMVLYLVVFNEPIRNLYIDIVFYPYFHAYTIINALLFPLLHFVLRFFFPFIITLFWEGILRWRKCE